ncbi:2OG-Fe(II) oxygenase family protein, partial [Rhodobiaceae bacterium]|nr:2OG-Fe(II) oxygenase family protein [Rhodobiaceae bacterium]
PKKFQLHGWVVNISKGGSLRPHIHKEGWMSGSLYFEIPKKILPDDGNIAFSLTGANYPTSGIDFEERMVETLKGEIVLFPSSIFHHTIAFESDEERMTIAFDVIPI